MNMLPSNATMRSPDYRSQKSLALMSLSSNLLAPAEQSSSYDGQAVHE
jgi:hypothetical protein